MGSAPEECCLGWLDARADYGAGQAVPLWRAGPGRLAPAGGRPMQNRRAAPGSRPSQRGHRDCPAVSLDGLLVLAGQVGMIMASFVLISGYKCSKNQSGRPDLNRRPLDPQECIHISASRAVAYFRR